MCIISGGCSNMPRFAITIEYKGTNYSGWQIQDNAITIQGIIQDSLSNFFKQNIKIVGSGRTDAGVHSEGQVAHFDCNTTIPADKIPFIINPLLPNDISIIKCSEVSQDFHARYSAKSKTYQYNIYISRHPSPLRQDTYHRILTCPNINKMKSASKILLGEHNFKCFLSTGSSVINTVREIYQLDIDYNKDEITIIVKGNGFLYNMVRIMAGTLLDIGFGKLTEDNLYDIIQNGRRECAGKTLPAAGLCLLKVDY